jgi:hypothetical protein
LWPPSFPGIFKIPDTYDLCPPRQDEGADFADAADFSGFYAIFAA